MKYNKLFFGLAVASMALVSCNDDLMEWQDSDNTVRPEELPLAMREIIDRYDYLKNYMAEYHPGVDITVGMGLDNFLDTEIYQETVLQNFQGCTFGNALKHQSIVGNTGAYNWGTVDRFINMNTGLKVHGHNLLWHTQQNQSYLKSLIAPEMQVGSTDNDILNVLTGDASNFDGGTKAGWGSWGNDSETSVVAPGRGGEGYCMLLMNPVEGSDFYVAQCAYTFSEYLIADETYKIRFYAKADGGGELQFQYQNGTSYGSQGGYHTFDVGTDWTLCEYEFTMPHDDVDRILINFGKWATSFYVDDIEFGVKNENSGEPADPMINILPATASTFDGITDGSTGGWGSWGSNKEDAKSVEGAGPDGSTCVVLTNQGDGNAWDAQFAYTFDSPLEQGVPYIISFEAKSEVAGGHLQFQYQNGTSYGSQGGYHDFETGTAWMPYEYEFTITDYEDVDRIILNFGKIGNTYYIDNIKFGPSIAGAAKAKRHTTRASSVYYVLKTPEEKKAILLDAMEDWIKEAMHRVGRYCTSYDVINEPIGDDISFRGINNKGWMSGDSEPVENVETGLNLNWENGAGNGHFYWGYYLGMDYGVKAFQFARKYADEVNPDMKLFVNDYNLETSPAKLAKLIEFVEYIDKNGAHVDGIGTQMHVSASGITKEQVDAMMQTLAKTGKIIRITELDVAVGTAAPSVEEQQKQADVYQMILTSYFENIPEAQQHGVTIWSLTDNAKEHEYWLNGDTPNIFDADYRRKIAYKGVCDAIIGFDPSGSWESPDYSKVPSASEPQPDADND